MRLQQYTRIIIGSMVLVTALLGYFVHHYWLFATMFVGANLIQFGFTGFCPMVSMLKKMGVKE